MPYNNEYATYAAVQRIVQSSAVQQFLPRLRVQGGLSDHDLPAFIQRNQLPESDWCSQNLLAIDGSCSEVPLPTTPFAVLLGYISVAAVAVDLSHLRLLDQQRPIDPRVFRTLYQTFGLEGVVPGARMLLDNDQHPRDAVRRSVYDLLSITRITPEGESLLDTYEALVRYTTYHANFGSHHSQRFSTDALRLHELLPLFGSNGAMLTEMMTILEHLWLVHYLRMLEQHQRWDIFLTSTFIMDGPLALFGGARWLSGAIHHELARIQSVVQEHCHLPDWTLHLFGVEKTGMFVDHFALLDTLQSLPPQTVMLMNNDYIKQYVVAAKSDHPYGYNTYYGQKILYKTVHNTRIVITVPIFDHPSPKGSTHMYPRLADTCTVIDDLHSARYDHALTALVHTHSAAALPASLSTHIFRQLFVQYQPPA